MNAPHQPARSSTLESKSSAVNNTGTGGISRPAVEPDFHSTAPPAQLMYKKTKDINSSEVKVLKQSLIELGLHALQNPSSATSKRFNEIIQADKKYVEEFEIFELLSPINDKEPPTAAEGIGTEENIHTPDKEEYVGEEEEEEEDEDVDEDPYYEEETYSSEEEEKDDTAVTTDLEGVRAVVLITGSKLKGDKIAFAKGFLTPEMGTGGNAVLAEELYTAIGEEKARGKGLTQDLLYQTLDQDRIHLHSANTAAAKLRSLGALVQIYRPPDNLILLPVPDSLAAASIPYAVDFADIAKFISATTRTVIVVIGHGDSQGSVNLPAKPGQCFPHDISGLLNLQNRDARSLLYIPLQCYPQKAVAKARAEGWHSASIDNHDKSDDLELERWVKKNLKKESKAWAHT